MSNETGPAVSIVTPCYNAAGYLPAMLDSVLAQDWTDWELLVVDDGSSDDPGSLVAARGDERIRFLPGEASGGPSRPRNRGIAAARGRFVFFCDADDVMLPGKLRRQAEALDAHPELGLTFTDFRAVDADDRLLNESYLAEYESLHRLPRRRIDGLDILDQADVYRALLSANFIGTSSVAVRKSVLDEAGNFDESLASSEDLDLWLRIVRLAPVGYLAEAGHAYRRHAGSLMHEESPRHPRARIEVMRRQLALDPDARARRAIRRRIAGNEVSLGYIHERSGDRGAARRHYWSSLMLQPRLFAVWGWLKTFPGGGLLDRLAARGRR